LWQSIVLGSRADASSMRKPWLRLAVIFAAVTIVLIATRPSL
jgi:MFS-type transporter involved in bile tolerance (Atg22 family)